MVCKREDTHGISVLYRQSAQIRFKGLYTLKEPCWANCSMFSRVNNTHKFNHSHISVIGWLYTTQSVYSSICSSRYPKGIQAYTTTTLGLVLTRIKPYYSAELQQHEDGYKIHNGEIWKHTRNIYWLLNHNIGHGMFYCPIYWPATWHYLVPISRMTWFNIGP